MPARTRPAPRARSGDLRGAILAAARRLWLRNGPDGLSARKIAAEVGVSATALYLHFRSVDDVVDHLRIEGHQLLAGYLRQEDASLPVADQVRALGRGYHRFALEHRGYFDLMFHGTPGRAPRREAVQREMFTLMLVRDVLQRGLARGELRADLDLTVATTAVWAQIHGAATLAVAGLTPLTSDGQADAVRDAVIEAAVAWLCP
jgi:AcrR family transcriptional regulator